VPEKAPLRALEHTPWSTRMHTHARTGRGTGRKHQRLALRARHVGNREQPAATSSSLVQAPGGRGAHPSPRSLPALFDLVQTSRPSNFIQLQAFTNPKLSQGPAQMQRRFISLFGLTVAVALLGAASRRQSSTILQQPPLLQQRLQQLWDFPYGGAPGEHPLCKPLGAVGVSF
jgi:hypothetical protein